MTKHKTTTMEATTTKQEMTASKETTTRERMAKQISKREATKTREKTVN